MFKDMEVARDEMTAYTAFNRERERKDRPAIDLSVNVLSAAAWPTYADVPVRIPSIISASINDFQQFYCNKHTGRRLNWKHQLAHCQLRARFPRGSKELVVSSFQAIVLLLFNDIGEGETLPYSEIQAATGLCKLFSYYSWHLTNTTFSGTGIEAHVAVAGMRQIPRLDEDAQGQGSRNDRRVLLQFWLHRRQDAHQD